jgi:uncharacterized membrane protein YqjE
MTPARDGSVANADAPPDRDDSPAHRDGPPPGCDTANPPAAPAGNRPAGDSRPSDAAAGGGDAGRRPRPSQASISQLLKALTSDLVGQVSDRVHLVALELKRAQQAVLQMAGLIVAAAILAATAWIALWVLVVTLAWISGLPWIGALVLVLLLNLVGGWVAFRRAIALAVYLTLPATVRRLTVAAPVAAGDVARAGAAASAEGRPLADVAARPGAAVS